MLSHYSPSQFVPMKTIGARNLKEVLRKAIAESNGNQSLEVAMIGSFQLFFFTFLGSKGKLSHAVFANFKKNGRTLTLSYMLYVYVICGATKWLDTCLGSDGPS